MKLRGPVHLDEIIWCVGVLLLGIYVVCAALWPETWEMLP